MITGAHSIIYTADAAADKQFFKDILKFPYVDIGHGWLIFGLPPSELALHPAAENGAQEFYLLCDNIEQFIEEMKASQVECSPLKKERWGDIVHISLPGGGKLGVYEPKHARPGGNDPG
jgi:hypothetical protein